MNEEEISRHIFRAYDIRGIYDKDISPRLFYKIGLAAGTYVKEQIRGSTLTIGGDIRCSSPTLLHSFISGVLATGVNVTSTNITSFGQTLFNGWQNEQDLIAFVTASHLPAEWNGIKFYYGDGVGVPTEELNKIRDYVLNDTSILAGWDGIGTISPTDAHQSYKGFFTHHFAYKKHLKVALDCGGASMTLSAPDVMNALGLTIVPVFCIPDPLFSQRSSEPKAKNLKVLIKAVTKEKCAFGVAFDGDGDRSVIVDDKSRVLSADQTGIILGKYGVTKHTGTVIVNVECSKAVKEQLEPLGYTVKQIPVGHTYLTLHAREEKSPLGIESSGHLILPEYFLFDDALIVPLKIAEIIEKTGRPLSALVDEIPIYPVNKEEIPCDDEMKFEIIERLKEQLIKEYDEVNTMDGVRVDTPGGWALIRASNTSPIIRLTTEADDKETLKNLTATFLQKTQQVIEDYTAVNV